MTTYQLGAGASATLIAAADQTDGQCSVVVGTLDPGVSGPPPHFHTGFTEVYVVLEGRLELRRGDALIELAAGDTEVVVAGTVHAVRNCGPTTVRWVNVFAPGGYEAFFVEAAAALPPGRPPDPALLGAVAARFDFHLPET